MSPSPSKRTSAGNPAGEISRDRMLDAAEEVVLRDGIGSLTLDAVAKEAKLSKGGLLHHYPNKDALISALVRRKIDDWRCDTAEGLAQQPDGPGRAVRAILNTCLSCTEHWTDAMRRSSVVLVAALVDNRKHVEPLRAAQREMLARFAQDDVPSGVGEAIHLAANGLWFDWIFGLSEWTPQRLAAVRSALQGCLDHAVVASAAPASAKKTERKTANKRVRKAPATAVTKREGKQRKRS